MYRVSLVVAYFVVGLTQIFNVPPPCSIDQPILPNSHLPKQSQEDRGMRMTKQPRYATTRVTLYGTFAIRVASRANIISPCSQICRENRTSGQPTMRAEVSALFLTLLVAVASRHGVLGQVPECTRTGGGRGQCRPLVKCVRFIHEVTELQKRPCSIGNGERGVCCPHVVIGTATCMYVHIRNQLRNACETRTRRC